jgi:2-methylcitrate dehydratase PrpD
MIARVSKISEPTQRLGDYMARAISLPLPDAVIEKARHHVLDTLAAMVSGTQLRPGAMAIDYVRSLGGEPQSSVVGTAVLTSTVNAALANGMLAHADETDDSHAPSRTHPGCAVIPAALAAAEHRHAGGQEFVRAVVLGYDICTRVNLALGADALAAASRSTHSIGGVFGAGAAAGALFGLDAAQVRHLLSYCAQQASGLASSVRDVEHIEKAFDFGGMPARNGVTAATMVAHGFTGVDDVFAGERNFFEAFASDPDPARLADALGIRFEILATNIKKWSVGSPAQAALDALEHLSSNAKFERHDIAAIEVHLPSRSARTVDNAPMPDVNVQHLIALFLVDGGLTFHSVHERARMDEPAVLAVREKITLVPSEALMEARPRRQSIVEIALRDGRRLSHRAIAVRGTADNPMTRAEVEAKALDLTAGVLGRARAEGLIEACRTLDSMQDLRDLRQYWQPHAPVDADAAARAGR